MVTREQVRKAIQESERFPLFGYDITDNGIDEVVQWARQSNVNDIDRILDEVLAISESDQRPAGVSAPSGQGASAIALSEILYNGRLSQLPDDEYPTEAKA